VLQYVAACCSALQPTDICVETHSHESIYVCCSVLQYVAVCCSMLQCVAVCCSVLQYVAACCSALQPTDIFVETHSHESIDVP